MVLHERERSSGQEQRSRGIADELADLARDLGADWSRVSHSLRRVAAVEVRRLQLKLLDSYFVFSFYVCALAAVVTATIAAAVLLTYGLRDVIAYLIDPAVAKLATGILGLMLTFGSALALRAWLRHRIVRSAARRLDLLGATSAAAPSTGLSKPSVPEVHG